MDNLYKKNQKFNTLTYIGVFFIFILLPFILVDGFLKPFYAENIQEKMLTVAVATEFSVKNYTKILNKTELVQDDIANISKSVRALCKESKVDFIYVIEQREGRWKYLSTSSLFSNTDNSAIEKSIIDAEFSESLTHLYNTGHSKFFKRSVEWGNYYTLWVPYYNDILKSNCVVGIDIKSSELDKYNYYYISITFLTLVYLYYLFYFTGLTIRTITENKLVISYLDVRKELNAYIRNNPHQESESDSSSK